MATATATATTTATSMTSRSKHAPPPQDAAQDSDLELRLLQAFGAFAADRVVTSYLYIKHSSRLLGFVAATTEAIATKSGLVALVTFLFAQYQRLGHPWVAYVDEAMGRRVIEAFVHILWLAKEQHEREDPTNQLEAGGNNPNDPTALRLSYQERIQALLQGDIPRVAALVRELAEREAEARTRAAAPPPVVMDLSDFVPKDEVRRLKENSREQLAEMQHEVGSLREQLAALEREKQRLEQDLTDVHNYQESERGRRFQEMEEELARTKLEASQKAHDLRKMELVVEAFRRKRKSKSDRSNSKAPSITSSDGPSSPSNAASAV